MSFWKGCDLGRGSSNLYKTSKLSSNCVSREKCDTFLFYDEISIENVIDRIPIEIESKHVKCTDFYSWQDSNKDD